MAKDYSKLDMAIALIDMDDTDQDKGVLGGIVIPQEHLEEFMAEVERLAVETYGGATFEELAEEDYGNKSMAACAKRNFCKYADRMLSAAEDILADE